MYKKLLHFNQEEKSLLLKMETRPHQAYTHIMEAGLSLVDKPELFFEILKINPENIRYLQLLPKLSSDSRFIFNILDRDWSFISSLEQNTAYSKTLSSQAYLKYKNNLASLGEELKQFGITQLSRFRNYAQALKILNNRKNIAHKNLPKKNIILILPDYNWIDRHKISEEISTLQENDYHVLFFESNHKKSFLSVFQSLNPIHRYSNLVIGGSGDRESIVLSKKNDETHIIDISIFQELIRMKAYKYLSPESNIFLEACYTGRGADKRENMANALRKAFPLSNITAPQVQITGMEYIFDEKSWLTGIIYRNAIDKIIEPYQTFRRQLKH